jgi:hypothetical protein
MLTQIWNTYRGWAKLARDAQTETERWNVLALILVCAAAIFGAISTAAPQSWSSWAAGAAALASALGAYLGRQFVGTGKEAEWIQARATAEGIKSECYRYTARSGPYAADGSAADAAKLLAARTDEISKQATDKGLVRENDSVPTSDDKRQPPDPVTKEWYKANRIQDQIEYYQKGRAKNQRAADTLWWIAFTAGAAAVVFGGLGAWAQRFTPWIGVMTTIAAAVAAYGLIDRRKYLIASYAASQERLERILAIDDVAPTDLADLVATTEDLLEGEHKAWLPQMLAQQHRQPAEQRPVEEQPKPQG